MVQILPAEEDHLVREQRLPDLRHDLRIKGLGDIDAGDQGADVPGYLRTPIAVT